MKALIQKELRELVKAAVLGLVILALLLLQDYHAYARAMRELALGGAGAGAYSPLAEGGLLKETFYFCAILGAVLGWLQIHNERRGDLWSFLVHRPVTRTQIFLAKIAAGAGLYVLAAGAPLAAFILWGIIPGHIAAPFEWAMLLPILARFLVGLVYYFAAMLVGLRQARWYASRGLPLPTAILVCAATNLPSFPWMFTAILAGIVVLGLAAWGSFHTNGFYQGQPGASKPALALALAVGAMVVAVAACVLAVQFVGPGDNDSSTSYYDIRKDGTIYRVTHSRFRPAQIVDLDGNPLKDAKTGEPVTPQEWYRLRAPGFNMDVYFPEPARARPAHAPALWFRCWQATPGTLWYYWPRYARLVAFDTSSRRPIGSLGPDGFSSGLSERGARFDYPPGDVPWASPTLRAGASVYQVQIEKRAATLLFTTDAGDPIGASLDIVPDYDWKYTALATRKFVYLVSSDGKLVWKSPYQPAYPDYDEIRIWLLDPPDQYALWLSASRRFELQSGRKEPPQVTWLSGARSIKSMQLPVLPGNPPGLDPTGKAALLLVPPGLAAMMPYIMDDPALTHERLWPYMVLAALLCVPVGWWLGRRYRFDSRSQVGWAVFLLLFGVPGLLALLSVQEWPAREPCPNCHRPRVVTRARCEHCGAAFQPRAPHGIEIFEPMSAPR
jgi:hypothetical protein